VILDTNSLSAWRDGSLSLLEVLASSAELSLPVIAIGEYRFGLVNSRRQADGEAWLNRVLASVQVLPVTLETTAEYGLIRAELKAQGRPIPANDLWIAALARQHDTAVLSRDRHFDAVEGIHRIDW
jgi:predicted nucleic acid-binding protein